LADERRNRPLVGNAGSERQVRKAERRAKERIDRFRDGLLATLSSAPGRAFIWGLLGEARVYASVWNDHGSRMAFNVGQQDYGHWLLAECLEVDEALTQLMEQEGRRWQRGEDRRDDAAQRAGDEPGETDQ
jgi:hypothetical protein